MSNLVIIGFGISTLCFLIYIYDNNLINAFDQILVLEKNDKSCLESLNYKNVNSNSKLSSLISIFSNQIFEHYISKVKNKYNLDKYINLSDYNKIIIDISDIFLKELIKYKNITIKYNYSVESIITKNNSYIINNEILANKIILATGAKHNLDYFKYLDQKDILSNCNQKILIPNNLYNQNKLNYLNNKSISIIGSSHSIMSIIDLIFKYNINYKSIDIYYRNKIKVFYISKEECLKNNDYCSEDDICTETQFINRFDGLRENSKNLFLNLKNYSNINLHKISEQNINNINKSDYIIPCWGYFKNIPKINNTTSYNIDSNNNFELLLDKKLYNNIYLLGISSNPKIEYTQKSFTKSLDGIWIYYNVISKKLYEKIINP
jgi:hypothetical protein